MWALVSGQLLNVVGILPGTELCMGATALMWAFYQEQNYVWGHFTRNSIVTVGILPGMELFIY